MIKAPYNLGYFDGLNARKYKNEYPPNTLDHVRYREGYDQGEADNDEMERSEDVY